MNPFRLRAKLYYIDIFLGSEATGYQILTGELKEKNIRNTALGSITILHGAGESKNTKTARKLPTFNFTARILPTSIYT